MKTTGRDQDIAKSKPCSSTVIGHNPVLGVKIPQHSVIEVEGEGEKDLRCSSCVFLHHLHLLLDRNQKDPTYRIQPITIIQPAKSITNHILFLSYRSSFHHSHYSPSKQSSSTSSAIFNPAILYQSPKRESHSQRFDHDKASDLHPTRHSGRERRRLQIHVQLAATQDIDG